VDCDIAVVDELAQIVVPDILVPFARVRRGVIVGDHRQHKAPDGTPRSGVTVSP
jgi:superfamily I DNA and/or RNA helicase